MSPNERRQELLEVLCHRRRDTYSNLVALLKKLGALLQGEDLATLNSIISDFAPYY